MSTWPSIIILIVAVAALIAFVVISIRLRRKSREREARTCELSFRAVFPLDSSPNGHIYPKEVMEKAVDQYRGRIEAGMAWGCVGVAPTPMPLKEISHFVTGIEVTDEGLVVDCTTFNTSKGRELADKIREAEGDIKALPNGYGSVGEKGVVQDDYQIVYVSVELEND